MRFASRRGQSHYDKNSVLEKEQYPLMRYKVQPKKPKERNDTLDLQSMIPLCSLDTFDKPTVEIEHLFRQDNVNLNCSLFEPVFTDIGMCHSYNPMPVLDILKPSYYTEAFQGAYEEDLRPNVSTHMGVDKGDSLTFYLYGNFHQKIAMLLDIKKLAMSKPTNFFFGITNKMEYVGMKNARKVIRAGYKYTWKIQAMEIEPSDDLRSLDLESRKCRFTDENEGLDIFKFYTKAGCDFELMVKKAQGICNCVPWYIPWNSNERYSICDFNGNLCFKAFMKANKSLVEEKCLPNCHEVQFTSAEFIEKLDSENFCDENVFNDTNSDVSKEAYEGSEEKTMTMKIRRFLKDGYLVEKVRRMKESTLNKDVTFNGIQKELCVQLVKTDLAKVTLMFERLKYIKTSTSLKMTFPDKLGAFGK